MIQRASQSEAWEEADRARIRASAELLKTHNAVSLAKGRVGRELEEAKNLSAVAESLKQSALTELNSTQLIVRELFPGGQESQELLDISQFSNQSCEGGTAVPRSEEHPGDSQQESAIPVDPGASTMEDWATPAYSEQGPASPRMFASPPEQSTVPTSNGEDDTPNFRRKSSELIKSFVSLGMFQKPASFSKEWENLAKGDVRRSWDPVRGSGVKREPPFMIEKPSGSQPSEVPGRSVNSSGNTELTPNPAGFSKNSLTEETKGVDEEILKGELAELRRSLESMRSSGDANGVPRNPIVSTPEPAKEGTNPQPPLAPTPQPLTRLPSESRPVDWSTELEASLAAMDLAPPPVPSFPLPAEAVGKPDPATPATYPVPQWDKPVADDRFGLVASDEASALVPPPDPQFPELVQQKSETALPPTPASQPVYHPSVSGTVDWSALEKLPEASEPPQSVPLPATCSGRLYLVFTPCPDAEMLGIFWEVLDEVTGVGGVVDARPIDLDGGVGFEFTLDLGNKILVLEDLKRQIPNSELVALDVDRLNVSWSAN